MDFPRDVYAIQHRVTKKMYIGTTRNLESRYQVHMSLLRNGKHSSRLMQKEYDEHGGLYDVFVLERIEKFSDRHKEYEWMEYYKTVDERYGYNSQDKFNSKTGEIPLKKGRPERICD